MQFESKTYLDRAVYVWTFIAQDEERPNGSSIKQPSGKAEVIDQSVKVSGNDHDKCNDSL